MLRTVAFIALCVVALSLSLRAPIGALLAYLWFALFRPQEWVWIDISGLHLSLVFGILLVVRSLLSGVLPDLRHRVSRGVVIFLATGLVAQMNATRPEVGWEWIDYFARLALVVLYVVALVDTQRRFLFAVLVVALSLGYYTAKAGVASLIGGGVRFSAGLAGAFVDNNAFALAGVMIIPFLWALARNVPVDWRGRRWLVWGCAAAIPMSAFTVVSTFSRGGILALLASLVVFVVLQRKSLRAFAIFALVSIAILAFVPLPSGYEERVATIGTYDEVDETSALSRLHFWAVAWDMAVDNPLGVGMRNFDSTYDRYDFSNGQYGTGRSVHNSHLQVLTEQGFVGFGIWMWLFGTSIVACRRLRRVADSRLAGSEEGRFIWDMATALIVSMVGYIIGGTFIALALNDLTWLTFGLVAALERVANRETNGKAQPLCESVPASPRGEDGERIVQHDYPMVSIQDWVQVPRMFECRSR